jgi:hypothetical protein
MPTIVPSLSLALLVGLGASVALPSVAAAQYGYEQDEQDYYAPRDRGYYRQDRRYYRDYDDYPRRRYGGRWDCNPSRCIDMESGALWESTCNYRGCFPLRPAGRRRY